MEDQIWLLKNASNKLEEMRQNIMPLWNDEASKTINRQFLDPHEHDNSNMVNSFSKQSELIDEAKTLHNECMDLTGQIYEKTETIKENIILTKEELENTKELISRSESECDYAYSNINSAQSILNDL